MQLTMNYFRLLIIIFCICYSNEAFSSYRLNDLPTRIAKSDLILKGTISSVKESTYTLAIDKYLKGNLSNSDEVEISKFKDWTCASKDENYASGQILIVFLIRDIQKPKTYFTIGSGNEGEARIIEDKVYIKFAPGKLVDCKVTPYGTNNSGYG